MRRISTKFGIAAIAAGTVALGGCNGSESTTSDSNTAVTDLDPGEGDGTIDDTTLIDATIGAEEEMGMESRMPADQSERAAASASTNGASSDEQAADADTQESPEPAPAPAAEPAAPAPSEPVADTGETEE